MKHLIVVILLTLLLSGCVTPPKEFDNKDPKLSISPLQKKFYSIEMLDGPPMTIAVYTFQDKTGQRKPNDKFSSLSSAVTQGAEVWVINALKKVGNGSWFQVVERIGLDNLIKERQLIRSTREQYENEKTKQLKPLKFAGLIVEGAVVGYDANIVSGGAGARYMGIGADTQYRVDNVTVSMRVVSVSTGEVLLSVAVEKTIASYASSVDIFKFLDLGTRAIEIATGQAKNEPVNYAVRAAIEQSVVEIIMEGERKNLWKFKKGETINVK